MLVTLHMNIFLLNLQVCPKNRLLQSSSRPGPLVPVISGWDEEWVSGMEHHPQAGVEPVLLEWMFHNAAAMQHREHQSCTWGLPLEPTETATQHPSVQTVVGSRDSNLLQVIEQIYKGKYMVAPRMFTHAQQDNFMKELQRQLSGCITRASLQGERGPAELPSRSWRHSQDL